MTLLKKGINIVKNLIGSSYLLEINKLTSQYHNVVVILNNNHQIDLLYEELKNLYKENNILKFPDYGIEIYDNTTIDKSVIRDRYNCLIDIKKDISNKIIITTFKSIFYRTPSLNDISTSWKKISKESNYNEIIDLLKIYKYKKTTKVEEPGQYRISGSIIDIFSINQDCPIRINFYDNIIETIKKYDLITQMSLENIQSTIICSDGLYNITGQNIDNYKKCIQACFDQEYMDDHEYEKIINEKDNSHIHHLVPKLFKNTGSLLSMLDHNFSCYTNKDIFVEYDDCFESSSNLYKIEKENRYILKPHELFISKNELNSIIENSFIFHASDYLDADIKLRSSYGTLPSLSINYSYKNPFKNLDNFFKNSKYKFIFFIKRNDNYKTLVNYLDTNDISYSVIEHISKVSNKINILRSDINEGFIDNSKKVVYVSSNDLFGLIKTRLTSNESIKAAVIDNLSDLRINDFIVHQEHGIGKYKGLITMNVEKRLLN